MAPFLAATVAPIPTQRPNPGGRWILGRHRGLLLLPFGIELIAAAVSEPGGGGGGRGGWGGGGNSAAAVSDARRGGGGAVTLSGAGGGGGWGVGKLLQQ